MVWVKLVADRAEIGEVDQGARSVRFYADEDVAGAIIGVLRSRQYEVETAAERGLLGCNHAFHFKRSAASRRVLLTHAKDYLNESRFPLAQTWGVCIVEVDRANAGQLAPAWEAIDTILGDVGLLWKEKKLVIENDYMLGLYKRGGEGEF